MTPERWLRIERIFHAALDLPPAERHAFLAQQCAGEPELQEEIAALLASDDPENDYLSRLVEAGVEASEEITADPRQAGETLGHYRIVSKLGAGGMGEVWLAEDTRLGRRVALKLLPRRFLRDAELLQRFKREARAASSLNHPNIITIYEIGQVGETHFIATEYIEGMTLRQRLRQGAIDISEVLSIARQVGSAIGTAHQAGIIHRDIKPENIMIRPDGLAKVLDFGLARIVAPAGDLRETNYYSTARGALIGTPRYMAPEQVRGMRVDHRADIFSLGVVLYEMLAGRPPFKGETMADQIAAILEREPEPLLGARPDLPPALQQVVSQCLAKDPDNRCQSMDQVLADLESLPGARKTKGWTPARPTARGTYDMSLAATIRQKVLRNPFRSRRLVVIALAVLAIGGAAYLGAGYGRGWWPFALPIPPPLAEAIPWYEIGAQSLRDGSYDRAREFFEQAVRKDPRFALARARLAEALAEQDYYDEAQQQLFQVYALIPDRSRLPAEDRLKLEAILYSVGRNQPQAIENYERLATLVPKSEEATVRIDLGLACEKNYETSRAIENYRQALRADPRSAAAYLRLAIIRGEREKDLAQSDAAFAQAEALYREAGNKEGLAAVYFNRGMINQALSRFEVARTQLTMAAGSDNQYLATRARIFLSENSLASGQVAQALREVDQALAEAGKNGMRSVQTLGLIYKAGIFHDTGDHGQAEKYYLEAIQSAQSYNGRYYLALARNNLGSLRIQLGRLDEGLQNVEPAYKFFTEANYRNEEMRALMILARARRLSFDYEGARSSYDKLLPLAQISGDEQALALVHSEIGQLHIFQETYPEALPHLDEAYRLYQKLGIRLRLPYALMRRARVSWQLGDYQAARTALKDAAPLATSNDVADELALAEVELHLSELDTRSTIRQSRTVLDRLKDAKSEMRVTALRIHGEALTLSGLARQGREYCLEAVALARSLGNQRLLADSLMALATTEAGLANWKESLASAQEARSLLASQGRPESEWRAWLLLAQARQSIGDLPQAGNASLQANAKLQLLRQLWGDEDFQRYLTRPDIKLRFARLANLSARK